MRLLNEVSELNKLNNKQESLRLLQALDNKINEIRIEIGNNDDSIQR